MVRESPCCSTQVKPVTRAGDTTVSVYLPDNTIWYNSITSQRILGDGTAKQFAAPINELPVFHRAGTIVAKKMRPRRSSALMANDPYTLERTWQGYTALRAYDDTHPCALGMIFIGNISR